MFAEGSPLTLAVLRIVFGIIAFFSVVLQLPYISDYYGPHGILPESTLALWQWSGGVPQLLVGQSVAEIEVFFYVLVFLTVSMTIGFFSRLSTPLVFIGFAAFHHRNPLILNSGDTLLKLVLLYLSFARSNATLSVDAYLRRKSEDKVALFPQRLIQIQIALLYFAATWWKFQGELWREGYVTWYVLQLEELARYQLPSFLITEWFARVTTWSTLAIELFLCTLVWFKPYRTPVLLLGLMLHAGIEITMNIPLFGVTTVGCYLAFYSGEELRQAASWLRTNLARLFLGPLRRAVNR